MRKPATKKPGHKRSKTRIGRPPRELAGEVDERILEAAHAVFIERGLAGSSIDEIARRARAGKPTIYARFPSKEALFTAVSMRNASKVIGRFGNHVPAGATIEERLATVATDILERLLVSEVIEFLRLSVAEVCRFPDLAPAAQMARGRAAEAVARFLSEVAEADEIGTFPAFAPERLAATTQHFMDLLVTRLFIRALTGEDLKLLRDEIGTHVTSSVAFFLAACRHIGVD